MDYIDNYLRRRESLWRKTIDIFECIFHIRVESLESDQKYLLIKIDRYCYREFQLKNTKL